MPIVQLSINSELQNKLNQHFANRSLKLPNKIKSSHFVVLSWNTSNYSH